MCYSKSVPKMERTGRQDGGGVLRGDGPAGTWGYWGNRRIFFCPDRPKTGTIVRLAWKGVDPSAHKENVTEEQKEARYTLPLPKSETDNR